MGANLMIWTVGVPLFLGLVCGLAMLKPRSDSFLALLVVAAVALAYAGLEGGPVLVPLAAKQKLFYLFALVAIVVMTAPRKWRPVASSGVTLAAVLWLGFNKFSSSGIGPDSWHMLVPVIAIGLAMRPLGRKSQTGFEKPLTALGFALGAAALSLIGVFVGFVQVAGAKAALTGGILLVSFVANLQRSERAHLPDVVANALLLSVVLIGLVIGLLAPQINRPAFAILSLGPPLALVLPGFPSLPRPLQPVLQGFLAVIPAILAGTMAALLQ